MRGINLRRIDVRLIAAVLLSAACDQVEDVSAGYTETAMARQCVPMTGVDPRACTVLQTGTVDAEDQLRYALYAVRDVVLQDTAALDDPAANGIAIFRRSGDKWQVSWTESPLEYSSSYYLEPVLRTQGDTILIVPVRLFAAPTVAEDRFLLRRDTSWVALDSFSWTEELSRRLPPGLQVRGGLLIDPHSLTAAGQLWREADEDCCPTSGSVAVQLTVRGTRLQLGTHSLLLPGAATDSMATARE